MAPSEDDPGSEKLAVVDEPTDDPGPNVAGHGVAWWPIRTFAMAAMLAGVAFAGSVQLLGPADSLDEHPLLTYPGDGLLGFRANWDGWWYTEIATRGYSYSGVPSEYSSPAFFPGYPLAMRLLNLLVRDAALAGIVVSVLAGGVATYFLYTWTQQRCGTRVARATVLTLLLYPYALYLYGVVYADALFLAAAVTAFVALERGRLLLAALLAMLACSTRLVGVAVAIGLILRLVEQREVIARDPGGRFRLHLDRLGWRDSVLAMSFLGTIAYAFYLKQAFGNAMLFQESAKAWGQGQGLETLFKARTVKMLTTDLVYIRLELAFQLALLIGALLLTRRVWRRFGWAYAAYVVILLGIPLVTVGNLFGAGRYVLPAFPCFAVLGEHLARRQSTAKVLGALSASVLLVSIGWFSRGFWVS